MDSTHIMNAATQFENAVQNYNCQPHSFEQHLIGLVRLLLQKTQKEISKREALENQILMLQLQTQCLSPLVTHKDQDVKSCFQIQLQEIEKRLHSIEQL
jgi:hypothetical protein